MDTQEKQEQAGKLRLVKSLLYGCTVLGFVMAVGSAGFVVASNLSLCTVAQLADVGAGLYAETLQLPQT